MWQILIGNLVLFPVYTFILNYILRRLIPKIIRFGLSDFGISGLGEIFCTSIYIGLPCGIAADILFICQVFLIKGAY